jgi:hypothetical protein
MNKSCISQGRFAARVLDLLEMLPENLPQDAAQKTFWDTTHK